MLRSWKHPAPRGLRARALPAALANVVCEGASTTAGMCAGGCRDAGGLRRRSACAPKPCRFHWRTWCARELRQRRDVRPEDVAKLGAPGAARPARPRPAGRTGERGVRGRFDNGWTVRRRMSRSWGIRPRGLRGEALPGRAGEGSFNSGWTVMLRSWKHPPPFGLRAEALPVPLANVVCEGASTTAGCSTGGCREAGGTRRRATCAPEPCRPHSRTWCARALRQRLDCPPEDAVRLGVRPSLWGSGRSFDNGWNAPPEGAAKVGDRSGVTSRGSRRVRDPAWPPDPPVARPRALRPG